MRPALLIPLLLGCSSTASAPATSSLVITAERPFVEQLITATGRDLGWLQDDGGAWWCKRVQIRIELEDRQGSTVIRVTAPRAIAEQLFDAVRLRLGK